MSWTTEEQQQEQRPNPYAPPEAECVPPGPLLAAASPAGDSSIAAALRRLEEHLARPENVEADRKLAGWPVGLATMIALGLGLASLAGIFVGLRELTPLFIVLGGVLTIAGIALLVNDLRLVSRSRAVDPGAALRGFYQSARLGRWGYFLSCLCPTARETPTHAPVLQDYPSTGGMFDLGGKPGVVSFVKTWARSGKGFVRWLSIKNVRVDESSSKVAVVSAELRLIAWPQWANILSLFLFLFIRLLGLIAAVVLYYALRKQAFVTVRKTMLRGSNGIWYVFDGAVERSDAPTRRLRTGTPLPG